MLGERTKDRAAALLIRVGGVVVILVVAAIVLNIGLEALPLFLPAELGPARVWQTGAEPLAIGSDARQEQAWALGRDGWLRFEPGAGRPPLRVAPEGAWVVAADHELHGLLTVLTSSGEIVVGRVGVRDHWEGAIRTTTAVWEPSADTLRPAEVRPWAGVTGNGDPDDRLTVAAWSEADGRLELATWSADQRAWERLGTLNLDGVRAVALPDELATVAVVDGGGGLRVWRLPDLVELEVEGLSGPVAAVRYLVGGGTLVAAGRDGSVAALLTVPRVRVANRTTRAIRAGGMQVRPGEAVVVPDDEVSQRLATVEGVHVTSVDPVCQVVRWLPAVGAEPVAVAAAHRRRDFLVGAVDGTVALYHSTSGRRLHAEHWASAPVTAVAVAPRGDGAMAAAAGIVLRRSVANPHPEVSLRTLFLPVWYEGYAGPRWVWQTSGGSESFEPKMSLWPLVSGTLKATLYAMLVAVPLALAAALYVSHLAPRRLQAVVKPAVELMAAVPSVAVGFVAALWLAPRLEAALLATLAAVAALPVAVVLALAVWRALPGAVRRRLPAGSELLLLSGCAAAMVAGAVWLAGPVEHALFGGNLQRYLFTEWGVRYDQRNSLVVGLALGFAVIPIIFTIAEDACSAVPARLVAASRALGASQWQTAVRLVVPAASPGLFAAVMLGFGRAVGETMIVLMAAGNTPLLGLSPFDGMRTMSAAIAVEIPEAPVGGTLFRVLFLTGTLLFGLTLVLTTVADTVGARLRKRYARF